MSGVAFTFPFPLLISLKHFPFARPYPRFGLSGVEYGGFVEVGGFFGWGGWRWPRGWLREAVGSLGVVLFRLP